MMEKGVLCRFSLGEVVKHLHTGFRGVVIGVDDRFRGDEKAYHNLRGNRPSKQQPWYQVLIDGKDEMTYLPEHSLESDASGEPITHPLIPQMFNGFENGRYSRLLH